MWRDNFIRKQATMTSPLERIKEVNYNCNIWLLNFPRRAAVNTAMGKRQTLIRKKIFLKGHE